MSGVSVYFARAMDARTEPDIIADDRKYMRLCEPLRLTIINPFEPENFHVPDLSFDLAESDLDKLKSSDVVLADLSLPDHQYVGCVFEIVHAAVNQIPVILIVGERDFSERVFFQAYCDFIAVETSDAIEYLRRAHTPEGIEQQMAEMKSYYDRVASCYESKSFRPAANSHDMDVFTKERQTLRRLIADYVYGATCEIGTGTGDWTATICEHSEEVLGLDISEPMLAQARVNLAHYDNLRLKQCDVLEESVGEQPFDCVVVYFLMSLLPYSVQDVFLKRLEEMTKPGGILLIADTKKTANLSAIGLGRKQLQQRQIDAETFTLYKEHFVGGVLKNILQKRGFEIVESSQDSAWFSWVAARKPWTEIHRERSRNDS